MTRILLLSVRFLDDCYHGLTDNGEKAEWPPSPFRMFQALVAGNARGLELPESIQMAMRWLEALEAPVIVAPAAHEGRTVLTYVLNNLSHTNPNSRTPKTIRPTVLNGDRLLQYAWRFDESENGAADHVQTIIGSARRIRCLGWGIDLAVGFGEVVEKVPIPTNGRVHYRPTSVVLKDGIDRRVPRQGSLLSLERSYSDSLRRYETPGTTRLESANAIYTPQQYVVGVARPFAAFKLLHPEADRPASFSQKTANVVAAMTRHATAVAAEPHRPRDWIDSYVHGHRSAEDDAKPRFSYLPLPSIERRGERGCVVGGIRRVLVAELNEAPKSQLGWARQMLPGQFLIDEKINDKIDQRKAMLAPLGDGDWVLRQYIGPSDTWATTTPVVLPGSDDGKLAKAEKLLYKALRHAGHSPEGLAEFEFRNVSFWPGGGLALRFNRPEYLRRDHWSVYHMRLRWKQPMQGPLAIGAGRHCGLGIFASFQADQ